MKSVWWWLYSVLYRCLSVRSMEYCAGLFVWGLEVCAHLVVGGVCVAEVGGGGFKVLGVVCVCDRVCA